MALQAWKLMPRGGLHLGREGLEQETSAESFPSDSLFAALVAQAAQLYGAQGAADLLAAFEGEPPFRLSSLFPVLGDLPLLPRPFVRPSASVNDSPEPVTSRKRLKKLAYVSPAVFADLLEGKTLGQLLAKGVSLHEERVLVAQRETALLPAWLQSLAPLVRAGSPLWNTDTVPRVTIDRISSASSIYRVGRTTFAESCGLWLLADVLSGGDLLEELLTQLGDVGIGGERSAGYGGFTITSMSPPAITLWDGQASAVTLSRYNPTQEEIQAGVLKGASYDLVDVGGWMQAPGPPPSAASACAWSKRGHF